MQVINSQPFTRWSLSFLEHSLYNKRLILKRLRGRNMSAVWLEWTRGHVFRQSRRVGLRLWVLQTGRQEQFDSESEPVGVHIGTSGATTGKTYGNTENMINFA